MKKLFLAAAIPLLGVCAAAQDGVSTPVDPKIEALQKQHDASLRAHLPFKADNEALQTPADPMARVPELREVQTTPIRDLFSDTWVAMDDAGRTLPVGGQVRAPRAGKTVGMFYYVNLPNDRGPIQDMTQLLAANPKNPKWGRPNSTYWWGEPDVGYRRSNDFWVLRRDLSMLADAGVDTLMFDTTNANTYWETYFNLCRVARWMHSMGQKTPQISFVTNHRMSERITSVYNELYSKNLYPEMWFRWGGKPIIFGKKDALDPDDNAPLPQEVQDFFTWRYSWAWASEPNRWNWIESSPQKGTPAPDGNGFESVPVTTASHPTNNIGKSFHDGKQPPLDELDLTPDTGKGLYFAEQMKRALELDPQFLWITQWNEWAAVSPRAKAGQKMVGRTVPTGEQYLVDGYNAEFNRDIAPMKGGWGDNYYLQLVDGIRRFKGARPIPTAQGEQKIDLNNWADWNKIPIEFRDSQGDTLHRDWPGHGGTYYKNASGRNDIITAKVAADARTVWFWAQSAAPLSPASDANWMQLLLNADSNYQTGWKGFDFAVTNYDVKTRSAVLQGLNTNGTRKPAQIRVPFRAQGNQLALALPRAILGLSNFKNTNFDFHWVDNAPIGGDIRDFWLLGDSAPNGRFNYRFQQTAAP